MRINYVLNTIVLIVYSILLLSIHYVSRIQLIFVSLINLLLDIKL